MYGSEYNLIELVENADGGYLFGEYDSLSATEKTDGGQKISYVFTVNKLSENGATITLESSWAINMLDTREAITTICGTKAGADMLDGLRINGIRQNRKYTFKPEISSKGAAFYDGQANEKPSDREARLWIESIINDTDPVVLPEEAYVVTQILEGIYTSAKTGDIYRFDK